MTASFASRFLAASLGLLGALAADPASAPMKPVSSPSPPASTELATFGGGCFWCLDAVFERLDGVSSVTSGYAGGHDPRPTYKSVCTGTTGHAEVVQIAFDPARIAYHTLLEVFWAAHDPTTLNRQGPDAGTQYRSVIFHHSETQRQAAELSRAAAASHFSRPIVTQIEPLVRFFPAEGYHQDYFKNNPNYPYCQVVIRPKLGKLAPRLRSGP